MIKWLSYILILASFAGALDLHILTLGYSRKLTKIQIQKANVPVDHIRTYSKVKDLHKTLYELPNNFYLAPKFSIPEKFLKNIQLTSSQSNWEKFHLIALDSTIDYKNLSHLKIGSFNFKGKKESKTFIQDSLNLDVKRLKLANHLDDLQVLLGLEVVQGLLLTSSQLVNIQENSTQIFHILWTSKKKYDFSYVFFGPKNAISKQIVANLKPTPISSIGVFEWKTISE